MNYTKLVFVIGFFVLSATQGNAQTIRNRCAQLQLRIDERQLSVSKLNLALTAAERHENFTSIFFDTYIGLVASERNCALCSRAISLTNALPDLTQSSRTARSEIQTLIAGTESELRGFQREYSNTCFTH